MKRARGLGFLFQRGSTWWIQYNVHGKRFRESGRSVNRADAIKLLKRRIAEAQAGKAVGPQVDRTTLRDLCYMVLDDYRAKQRRSVDRVEDAITHLYQFFGDDNRARDITTDRVTAYRAQRLQKGAANATINCECAVLRRGFRLAVKASKVTFRPDIETPTVENARKGFFEVAQYRAVVDDLPDYLKPLATVAFITGWRTKSELLTRQWRHIDLARGWLRLDPGESKNGDGREFPFTPELRTVLEAQRERARHLERTTDQIVPWVFTHPDGSRIKNFRYTWAKACRRAGVPGRLVHDFRRTAVRNLERAGVPRSAAMKLTGHRTETVYRRYAITDAAMLQEAAAKLAAFHALEADTSPKTFNATVEPQSDRAKVPS
jgi:integrase